MTIDGPRWPEYPRPFRWSDEETADIADATDDARRQAVDVEWSTEQTFVGEFGDLNAFGDPID